MNILPALERMAFDVRQSQISSISPASMLFTKFKQLYLKQERQLQKQQSRTKTSVFSLATIPSDSNLIHTIYQTASVIPNTIQNKSSIPMQSIKSLIKILDLISDNNTPQLINRLEDCLIRKICGLKQQQQVLKMFTKLMYTRRYLERGQQGYAIIEDRVIKELLNISFSTCDSNHLVKFVFSMPYSSQSLLPLLSYFIEETQDEQNIKKLYQLFNKLFPQKPSKQQIKYLLNISTKEATQRIHQMVKRGEIDSQQMLEQEAKRKLKKVPNVFNSKGEAIMMFVSFVALYGGGIWQQIIQWQKTAIKQYKDWFKNNAQNIVNDNHAKDHLQVILLKLTNINYESQISELFFDHVILQKNKSIFNSVIIKRFLASKIFYKLETIKDNNQNLLQSKFITVFDPSLVYVDILLEMFEDENKSLTFYSFLLQNSQQSSRILLGYLDQCWILKKFKFIQFFLAFMNTSRSQLLQVNQNKLLLYYISKIDLQTAYTLNKQLSIYNPSKFYILFMKSWFFQLSNDNPQKHFLKSSIIRNINILLIRSQLELNRQFIADFKQHFYKNLNPEQKHKILNDVPKARKQQLGL